MRIVRLTFVFILYFLSSTCAVADSSSKSQGDIQQIPKSDPASAKDATSTNKFARLEQPPTLEKDVDAPAKLRPSYQKCLKASNSVTSAMQDCIENEYDYQDYRLNRAYRTLTIRLNEGGRASLRAEERKWIIFRDYHCELAPDGGQAQRAASNDCSLEQTAKRAAALEVRLH